VVIRLSDTPGRVDSLGPDLGAHNADILCGRLGLSSDQLQSLIADDAI
jgi:crotonobetainyl-CoA:carnitine CoA-transferase CaiB-like acyl-CoA transferase